MPARVGTATAPDEGNDGAVLGQVAVEAKSNEIPTVRKLLKAFADLAGAVITFGALHTQSDTAQLITGRHADYVMTVKSNVSTEERKRTEGPERPALAEA